MAHERPHTPARAERASPGIEPLVLRARAGEVAAWSQLYQQHYDRVYRRLYFFVSDAAVAEDLTQECFARAVTIVGTFDGRSSFAAWLVGVALNMARNYLRGRQARRRAEEHLRPLAELTPRDPVERGHLRRRRSEVLFGVLLGLPENLREAFVVRELEQLSTAEAAEVLGISSNNVAVRVHRARELVRKELTRLGWLDADGRGVP